MIPPVSERLLPYISDHKVLLQIWKDDAVESLQSHSSIPRGVLMWNMDSPVSVVSLHWWPRCDWSLWPRLRRASSDNVIIPLDLTQLFCPGFSLAAGPPSGFTTDIVGCWGGALWRACNLTPFIHSSTVPVVHPFASRHEGPEFNPQGGSYVKPGFSCYRCLATMPLWSENLVPLQVNPHSISEDALFPKMHWHFND
jgi:hypothetical protein